MRVATLILIAGAMTAGACAHEPRAMVFLSPPTPSPLMGSTLYPQVPAARAGTSPPRWEYLCTNKEAVPAAGAEGWELTTTGPGAAMGAATVDELGMWFCFRRPLPTAAEIATATTAAPPTMPTTSCVRYEDKNEGPQEKCFDTVDACREHAVHLHAREDQYRDVSECSAQTVAK